MDYKIFKDGVLVNTIVADEKFCLDYCQQNGYTYEKIETEQKVDETDSVQDNIDRMLIEQEYRITMLELGITA